MLSEDLVGLRKSEKSWEILKQTWLIKLRLGKIKWFQSISHNSGKRPRVLLAVSRSTWGIPNPSNAGPGLRENPAFIPSYFSTAHRLSSVVPVALSKDLFCLSREKATPVANNNGHAIIQPLLYVRSCSTQPPQEAVTTMPTLQMRELRCRESR